MSTIEKAAASTTVIQDHAGTALEVLQSGFNGRIVNGHGIYVDPSGRRRDLLEARKAIDAALAVIGATKWPTGLSTTWRNKPDHDRTLTKRLALAA